MPIMDWNKMLFDGTIDIGVVPQRGPAVFIGDPPVGRVQVELYIPGTVLAGTTTFLIEYSNNDAAWHTLYTYDVPDQNPALVPPTGPTTVIFDLPEWPTDHHYLNARFSAIQALSDLGTVQCGLTIGRKEVT